MRTIIHATSCLIIDSDCVKETVARHHLMVVPANIRQDYIGVYKVVYPPPLITGISDSVMYKVPYPPRGGGEFIKCSERI